MRDEFEYYHSPDGTEMRLLPRSIISTPVYNGWKRSSDITRRDHPRRRKLDGDICNGTTTESSSSQHTDTKGAQ